MATRDAHATLIAAKRNHNEADTMLDALRDDVYRAVLWGARGDKEHLEHSARIREVQIEFAEHVQNLKARIAANSKLGINDSLQAGLSTLQNSLDVYLRSAQELIAVAGDQEKAVSKLDGFQNTFEALQKAMNIFGDSLDGYVSQRKQSLQQHTHFSQTAVRGVALLGLALISLLGFALHRNTAGAMRREHRGARYPHTDAGGLNPI